MIAVMIIYLRGGGTHRHISSQSDRQLHQSLQLSLTSNSASSSQVHFRLSYIYIILTAFICLGRTQPKVSGEGHFCDSTGPASSIAGFNFEGTFLSIHFPTMQRSGPANRVLSKIASCRIRLELKEKRPVLRSVEQHFSLARYHLRLKGTARENTSNQDCQQIYNY
jgi:hypothetical protein